MGIKAVKPVAQIGRMKEFQELDRAVRSDDALQARLDQIKAAEAELEARRQEIAALELKLDQRQSAQDDQSSAIQETISAWQDAQADRDAAVAKYDAVQKLLNHMQQQADSIKYEAT